MADPPHLIKNVRNCLLMNKITLPNIETTKHLQAKEVDINHIKSVYHFQKNLNLKLLPKITDEHFHPSNYRKMRVNMAAQLMSHTVASAMYFSITTGAVATEAMATAYFCDEINQWFDIINNRNEERCLNNDNLNFLKDINILIRNLKFSDGRSWKPIQKGFTLTNETIKCLYYDLKIENIKFLTGRLTQDCVENLFSQLRSKSDNNPSALKTKINIKLITLTNYLKVNKNTNYADDESIYLLNILKNDIEDIQLDPHIIENLSLKNNESIKKYILYNRLDFV